MKDLLTLNDPMGSAIYDYHKTGKADLLMVRSTMFDDDNIPVETLFRDFKDMPELERYALKMAKGRILDVGAGSGCHSLALKDMGKDVVAIDNICKNADFAAGIYTVNISRWICFCIAQFLCGFQGNIK